MQTGQQGPVDEHQLQGGQGLLPPGQLCLLRRRVSRAQYDGKLLPAGDLVSFHF